MRHGIAGIETRLEPGPLGIEERHDVGRSTRRRDAEVGFERGERSGRPAGPRLDLDPPLEELAEARVIDGDRRRDLVEDLALPVYLADRAEDLRALRERPVAYLRQVQSSQHGMHEPV